VAVQELRFGDNDTLSAQVATLVEADYLFLMTDVDALYTANPKVTGVVASSTLTAVLYDFNLFGHRWLWMPY
jgi:glutamate 5-kinase